MRKLHWASWAVLGLAVVVAVTGIVFVLLRPSVGSAHHRQQQPVLTLAAHSDGLSDAENGYRFVPVATPTERGEAIRVAFRVIGPSGRPETEFLLNQTKQMHFFVVRDDMHVYQHVHPELVGDLWQTTIKIADGGAYRMFAEFIPRDTNDPTHPVVLGVPFSVSGETTLAEVPPPSVEAAVEDGFTVLRTEGLTEPRPRETILLRLSIRNPDGTPVKALDEHLGAYGHMTGFNVTLLSATHLHPREALGTPMINGELTFQAIFAERGEHRLFLEFTSGGKIRQAAFTIFVN